MPYAVIQFQLLLLSLPPDGSSYIRSYRRIHCVENPGPQMDLEVINSMELNGQNADAC